MTPDTLHDIHESMRIKADFQGAEILDTKPVPNPFDPYFIVLAINHKGEYVTWLWANGSFHWGHYFGSNVFAALSDLIEREQ